ncbi:hypothetical protein RIF29_23902 [Crotalaria pallida]|uniref:Uncharacterized protein n=1 Tax=Crotalaria pallida TaxID=3830 RepID=A0AAN9EIU6_CROPI
MSTSSTMDALLPLFMFCYDFIILIDKVANVLISNKHSPSSSSSPPCVLVSDRVLEINPDHPIIMKLNAACKTKADDEEALRTIDLLYDAALLSSGFTPQDPAQLGGKIYKMMDMALCGIWSK